MSRQVEMTFSYGEVNEGVTKKIAQDLLFEIAESRLDYAADISEQDAAFMQTPTYANPSSATR